MNVFTDRRDDSPALQVDVLPLLESATSAVRQHRDLDALALLTAVVAHMADGDLATYRATHQLREVLKGRRHG